MKAVVLRGPTDSAPDIIIGPFVSIDEARKWAYEHPRPHGYCIAQEMIDIDEFAVGHRLQNESKS
jgi:hypothetical protein